MEYESFNVQSMLVGLRVISTWITNDNPESLNIIDFSGA